MTSRILVQRLDNFDLCSPNNDPRLQAVFRSTKLKVHKLCCTIWQASINLKPKQQNPRLKRSYEDYEFDVNCQKVLITEYLVCNGQSNCEPNTSATSRDLHACGFSIKVKYFIHCVEVHICSAKTSHGPNFKPNTAKVRGLTIQVGCNCIQV